MKIIKPSAVLSLAFTLAACAKVEERPADTSTITTPSTTQTAPQAEPPASTPAPAPAPAPDTSKPATSWAVTENGIGKLRAGMTVADAKAAYPSFSVPAGDPSACSYAKMNGLPSGVAVMVEAGKVARVEVRSGSVATSTGARIGDTEAKIKSLYPNQVAVTPHKYEATGHYLTVTPSGSANNRIIFETDGKRVTNYRAGARPQVEYVERCG